MGSLVINSDPLKLLNQLNNIHVELEGNIKNEDKPRRKCFNWIIGSLLLLVIIALAAFSCFCLLKQNEINQEISEGVQHLVDSLARHNKSILRIEEKIRFENMTSVLKKSLGSPCSDGWLFLPETNSCYKLILVYSNYREAKISCQQMGSSLVSIHSRLENIFVNQVGLNYIHPYDYTYLWIGVVRENPREDNFVNVDGTPFDFAAWRENEPNNARGIEDCVQMSCYSERMDKIAHSARWNDNRCDTKLLFVCKKRAFL